MAVRISRATQQTRANLRSLAANIRDSTIFLPGFRVIRRFDEIDWFDAEIG